MKSLIAKLKKIRVMLRLMKKERQAKNGANLWEKLFCYRRGFFSDAYFLYDFSSTNPKEYLSDIEENINSRHINRNGLIFIDNKLLFPSFIQPFLKVNQDKLIIMNGKPVMIHQNTATFEWSAFLDLMEKENKSYILKEIDGASGFGIYKIGYSSGTFEINYAASDRKQVQALLEKLNNYSVSDILGQADYSNRLYPKSVNTIRILTMIDPDTGAPFIAAAAHRIGNAQSAPVDNCALGGITAPIDINTGIMGMGVRTKVRNRKLEWFVFHPDSGEQIRGAVIPQWNQICSTLLDLAGNISFLPYIGWDIVVQNDGITIIEGNDGPDIKLHQVHGGLLANPRIKRFYQFHQVI